MFDVYLSRFNIFKYWFKWNPLVKGNPRRLNVSGERNKRSNIISIDGTSFAIRDCCSISFCGQLDVFITRLVQFEHSLILVLVLLMMVIQKQRAFLLWEGWDKSRLRRFLTMKFYYHQSSTSIIYFFLVIFIKILILSVSFFTEI